MPATEVVFYKEAGGAAPVLEWLRDLRARNAKAFFKCNARVERLAALGHDLRRPESDILRDGIYELRAREGRVQYRILYFFHGRNVAILAHAITKEGEVPDAEINRALARKARFQKDPATHTLVRSLRT